MTPSTDEEEGARENHELTPRVDVAKETTDGPPRPICVWAKPLALIAVLILAFVGLQIIVAKLGGAKSVLHTFGEWIEKNRLIGDLAYVVVYIASFVAMVPSTPMELLGAYVFGFGHAFLILVASKPLAYIITFMIGRFVELDRCSASLQQHARLLAALEIGMAGDPRAKYQIVFLVCLSFLPAGVKTFGMAAISAVTPCLLLGCSFLASLPYTFANAWIGSSAKDLNGLLCGDAEMSPEAAHLKIGMVAIGAVSLVLSLLAVGWYVNRFLDEIVQDVDTSPDHGEPSQTTGDG